MPDSRSWHSHEMGLVMRSIPEKTFEHWCAMHLSYRYRAHLQMWWPSSTADIDVAGGPLAPGKRVWLELKTTEWNAKKDRHDLYIDLGQLYAYGLNPIPDYYVFPVPPWVDVLGAGGSLTWLSGLDRTAIAYQSQSGDLWFAEWTFVVSGKVLRRALRAELAGLPTPPKKKTVRLAEINGGALAWVPGTMQGVHLIQWHDFWAQMESCGDAFDRTAEFLLPVGELSGSSTASHTELTSAVRRIRAGQNRSFDYRAYPRHELNAWVPNDDGVYTRTTTNGRDLAEGFRWDTESDRVLSLLGAGVLDPA